MNPFRRELEYFLLISDSLNLSVAAERAGIQQAGLSRSLKQLEQELGQPLFYRTNRGLTLTPFGSIMRSNLVKTMGNWEESYEESLEKFREVSGTVSIGAHPTIAINSVSKVFAKLVEEHKDLYLNLQLKKSADVTRDVLNFKLDLGIVANPNAHQDLVIKQVDVEYICLWGRKGKANKQVIYYNPEMIGALQNLKKYRAHKRIEVADYEVIASIIQSSGGVGLLPSPVGERTKGLTQVGKPLDEVSICLIYRFDILKTKAFEEVLTQLGRINVQI